MRCPFALLVLVFSLVVPGRAETTLETRPDSDAEQLLSALDFLGRDLARLEKVDGSLSDRASEHERARLKSELRSLLRLGAPSKTVLAPAVSWEAISPLEQRDLFVGLQEVAERLNQPRTERRQQARIAPSGSVRGRVLSADGNQVEGVLVRALDQEGNWLFTADTESGGEFSFHGEWTRHIATLSTYNVEGLRDRRIALPSVGTSGLSSGVELSDLVLAPGATFSGNLSEAGTSNALTADVHVFSSTFDASGNQVVAFVATSFAQTGTYLSPAVSAGNYLLVAETGAHGMKMWPDADVPQPFLVPRHFAGAEAVAISDGDQLSGFDFVLTPWGKIQGRVVDSENGQPLEGVFVQGIGSSASSRTTDALGNYELGPMPSGPHLVWALKDGWVFQCWRGHENACSKFSDVDGVVVRDGRQTSSVDFELRPEAILTGEVRADGVPVPSDVYLYRPDLTLGGNGLGSGTDYTAKVAPGYYYVTARARSGTGSKTYTQMVYPDQPCAVLSCTLEEGTLLHLAAGTTTNLDFDLVEGGRVEVRVFRDSIAPANAIVPPIAAFSSDGVRLGSSLFFPPNLSILTLPEGENFLVTEGFDPVYADEVFSDVDCLGGACDPTSGSAVAVPPSGTVAIDIVLNQSPSTGEYSVRAVDEVDGRLLNAAVYFYTVGGELVATAVTDSFLNRTPIAIRPGRYKVVAGGDLLPGSEMYPGRDCGTSGCNLAQADSILIRAGESVDLDFSLRRPPVFFDGFEIGTRRWTFQVPQP